MKVTELSDSGADIAYVTPVSPISDRDYYADWTKTGTLKWAKEEPDRYVIEDDYDSEFRYKGKPIPALAGNDRTEKLFILVHFQNPLHRQSVWSHMVLPGKLQKRYEREYSFVNSTVSKVDQMIVQRFIEEGYYERHLNKTRAMYKGRHDTLIEELKPLLKNARFPENMQVCICF